MEETKGLWGARYKKKNTVITSKLLAHTCHKLRCNASEHLWESDKIYDSIVSGVQEVNQAYVTKMVQVNKYKIIPGWNGPAKQLHSVAREKHLNWINSGKMLGNIMQCWQVIRTLKRYQVIAKLMNTQKYVTQLYWNLRTKIKKKKYVGKEQRSNSF